MLSIASFIQLLKESFRDLLPIILVVLFFQLAIIQVIPDNWLSVATGLAIVGLGLAVFLLGLGAIYRSAHAMVDLSERRTRFVSSVTHELKTPLTNIRMYIEMLEQGIARDTAREQDYLRVVGSESARLSRLINNVLELSRLEKRQRQFDMRPGTFEEVLEEQVPRLYAALRGMSGA